LFGGHGFEESFGHDGQSGGFDFDDVLTIDGEGFGHGLEGERAGGLLTDDAVEDATILEGENGDAVIGGDHGAGIDEFFQQVFQIVAS
jgi:hypothetical protein